MNFYVAKGRYKTSPFDVFLRTSRKEEIRKIYPNCPRKSRVDRRVPRKDWEKFGFYSTMTFEQARARGKQLNASKKLEKEAAARIVSNDKIKEELAIESAYLPHHLVDEYLEKLRKDFYGTSEEFLRSKALSYWRISARVIREVAIDPKDWEEERRTFYKYFMDNAFALSTVQKVISELNKWGKFQARKSNTFFENLSKPRGRDMALIVDAYESSGKKSKESAPLFPNHLLRKEDSFKADQFNWLFVSLWFGLRPAEVDKLTEENKGTYWKLSELHGRLVLHIFQTKLNSIRREKRWKLIPCLFQEQVEAVEMIKTGELRRPLGKTMQRKLGEEYTCYAGRKGFESLMREKGVPIEYTSAWLGHQNVDRTWKSYRDRMKVIIPKGF